MNNAQRDQVVVQWVRDDLGLAPIHPIKPASADASFRRYLRIQLRDQSLVIMDAPPEHEDVRPFMAVAEILTDAGVRVPRIHEADPERGLLLLEDFGDRHMLAALLQEDPAARLARYREAIDTLLQIRAARADILPAYDNELLTREMNLYTQWYIGRHLGVSLSESEQQILDEGFERILNVVSEQPSGFVHRDYHSRNLMALDDNRGLGVLDFQDAVAGGVTYDLVSLLRDSYFELDEAMVENLIRHGYDQWRQAGLEPLADWSSFRRWFDHTAAQRHLKVLGIFARLSHRDAKHGYLADMPLTHRNLLRALAPWPELASFRELIASLDPERKAS
ncbi:MAG: aminoglycoside phosphotransferase family protein [Halothiobacillaceae bacterium]